MSTAFLIFGILVSVQYVLCEEEEEAALKHNNVETMEAMKKMYCENPEIAAAMDKCSNKVANEEMMEQAKSCYGENVSTEEEVKKWMCDEGTTAQDMVDVNNCVFKSISPETKAKMNPTEMAECMKEALGSKK